MGVCKNLYFYLCCTEDLGTQIYLIKIIDYNNKKCIRPSTGLARLPIHALLFLLTQKGKECDTGIHSYVIYQVVRLG